MPATTIKKAKAKPEKAELSAMRLKWERGLTAVAEHSDAYDTVYVVLDDAEGRFHCHRYFRLGGKYQISVDRQNDNKFGAFKWAFDMASRK